MPKINAPRRGSMQYWPRKKAKDIVARIRSWIPGKEAKLLGFAGYKVGMTHLIVNDNVPTSLSKGLEKQVPVTILECPPLKIAAILLYTKDAYGLHCVGQINAEKLDKEVLRKLTDAKKKGKEAPTDNLAEVRVLAYTQPKLTTIGKKKPEFFELGIGGKVDEKLAYAKEILGKEIKITDVFNQGQYVDSISITKGKGFQGPVKRFGVMLRHHKSEKSRRNSGSLGPWHGHRQYRVPKAGQTGFQQRRESNKYIVKIGDDIEAINSKAGFLRYGVVKNSYVLIKGSLSGSSKRLITLLPPQRKGLTIGKEAPEIVHISTTKQ